VFFQDRKKQREFLANSWQKYSSNKPLDPLEEQLALKDQLSINQPKGIREVHQKLIKQYEDQHIAEHLMMECIAEMIYLSQKNNTTMNQESYLNCITSLARK